MKRIYSKYIFYNKIFIIHFTLFVAHLLLKSHYEFVACKRSLNNNGESLSVQKRTKEKCKKKFGARLNLIYCLNLLRLKYPSSEFVARNNKLRLDYSVKSALAILAEVCIYKSKLYKKTNSSLNG